MASKYKYMMPFCYKSMVPYGYKYIVLCKYKYIVQYEDKYNALDCVTNVDSVYCGKVMLFLMQTW
jgi:hypothetical protein